MRAYTWQSWPDRYKSQFPQVDTDLRNGTNAVWVMTHADEKKKTYVLFWDWEGGPLSVYGRRSDWDFSDNSDDLQHAVTMIDGNVPLDGWISLEQDFLTDLGP
jgi:hypothetical protein